MARPIFNALVVAAVVLIAGLIYVKLPGLTAMPSDTASTTTSILIKDRAVQVVVADTPERREQGLSGWAGLPEDTGMLFVFDEDDYHAFWMKEMRFSIDIAWISRDGFIVHIEHDVSPQSFPAVFTPREEARYAVELPAGWVETYDVAAGDIVRL